MAGETRAIVYVFMLILFVALMLLINSITFLGETERLILFLSCLLLIGTFVVLTLKEFI